MVLMASLYKLTYRCMKVLIHICKYARSYTCTLTNKHASLHMCAFKYRERHRARGPSLCNVIKRWEIVYCPELAVTELEFLYCSGIGT